jgi:hypothetical protein
MSEYQYYEFLAVDKPLTERQMMELRAISTRAHITPTSFVNTYQWGDLKADPRRLVAKYFDAHVYLANWGTRRFLLRLPAHLLDEETLAPYCVGDSLAAKTEGSFLLLDFMAEEVDSEEWDTGEGWMGSLVPLRADLMVGDLRALYLGWLLCAQNGELGDDEPEPPLPPGLGEMTASLSALADFLGIAPDLIAVAAQGSPAGTLAPPAHEALETWVRGLPVADKDVLLLRLLEGDAPTLRAELLKRLRQETTRREAPGAAQGSRRTVGQLLALADAQAQERERREAEERAAEQARHAQEQAIARRKHLDGLVGTESKLWREVEACIRTRQPKQYDDAVRLLRDLRDLGVREGTLEGFHSRLRDLRARHSRKPALLQRLDRAALHP